tara:strand:+ start:1931 stop:2308 length:378 start_codon:yes stop_codon:yes gene_type:complete
MSTKSITVGPVYKEDSIQAKFSKKTIEDKLKDYKEYKSNKWESIQPNDRVRYFTNGSFKSGGQVKQNNYPKYLVIANYNKNISWCVQYTDPTLRLFVQPISKMKKKEDEMKKIYEKFKKGELVPK